MDKTPEIQNGQQGHHRNLRICFEILILLSLIGLVPTPAVCDEGPHAIVINTPYVARINEPITIQIEIVPPPQDPVSVKMTSFTAGVQISETDFKLKGAQKKFLTVTFKNAPPSGLGYILAHAEGYDAGWAAFDLGFDGHLKPTWTEPLSSDTATTMSLDIVDRDGKPIPFEGDLQLTLDTTDGILNGGKGPTPLTLTVASGSRATPQFRLQPRFARGGNVHLTAVLTVYGYQHVLAQNQFVFPAQPASWLLVLLALLGGFVHAIYKLVRTPTERKTLQLVVATAATSLTAAFLGYLFADYDLLGLKLDPNLLRTYPIVGFLFSYLGIDAIVSHKLSPSGDGTVQTGPPDSTGTTAPVADAKAK